MRVPTYDKETEEAQQVLMDRWSVYDLNVRALADAVGVTTKSVLHYATGVRKISRQTLVTWATEVGEDPDTIFRSTRWDK